MWGGHYFQSPCCLGPLSVPVGPLPDLVLTLSLIRFTSVIPPAPESQAWGSRRQQGPLCDLGQLLCISVPSHPLCEGQPPSLFSQGFKGQRLEPWKNGWHKGRARAVSVPSTRPWASISSL